ncbi:MAG: hypothetical protein LBQ89_00360 [Treponema sp.]|jgi:hypothetical protein|nr:hypothetical protein [Treponema sp.]
MTIKAEKFRGPPMIFLIYVLVSCCLVMLFRFIFPGSDAPLWIYSRSWRLIQGFLEVFNMFPALAFSALVIPFGFVSYEEKHESFSDIFFKRLAVFVIIAICAAVVYGLIFFLAFPMVKNREEDLRYNGELYLLAKQHAQERRSAGEWVEASQYIGICDRIWPDSPELSSLRTEIEINLERIQYTQSETIFQSRAELARNWRDADVSPLTEGPRPVDAAQAIIMAETAFDEKRYFDAHWLATLGERLAIEGGPEAANAARLASRAWNMIDSQAPNRREERQYELYEIKLSGYQAMNSGDWILAFYIFQELTAMTPDDPDAANFLAASERGAREYAFFLEEIEVSLGEILTGAVFSLSAKNGRAALRFSSLTTSEDVAYALGFEYMWFDMYLNLQESAASRYAKLLPFTLNGKPQVLILTHALDRSNMNNSYDSQWLVGTKTAGGILLDVSYEDFLLISSVRRGLHNFQINELFSAATKVDNAGYVYQIFQAEILNRLGSALFFLPMAIFVIAIGWRYRVKTRPRYLFVLMLPVLPVVFHGFVFLYRSVFNILGIWLVLSIGFSAALVITIVILALSLFISLITLAAQHS